MVPKRGLVEVRITRVFANTSVIIHLISAVGGKSLRFIGHSEGGTFPAFAWGCFFLGRGKSWRAWRALPCERGARYRLIFSCLVLRGSGFLVFPYPPPRWRKFPLRDETMLGARGLFSNPERPPRALVGAA